MNRHALDVIQYNETLSVVAGFASGPLGAEAVRGLEPTDAIGWIEPELERVAQMMGFIQRTPDFGMPAIPDCRVPLRRLATPGSVLEPAAFRDLANLMRSSRLMAQTLRRTTDAPAIAEMAGGLAPLEAEESRVRHAVDENGEVRDGASRELAGIRREMRGARSRVVQKLEQYMATLPARIQVADASVTLREGRYVIPIRKEGRGDVGGLVHDESATGQTLFVEPPIAIELMNRLRELEIAEVREVQRILRELTDSLRPQREALVQSLDALVRIDSVWARARFAMRYDGHRPDLARDASCTAVHARHPLLLATGADVVPFDLAMEPHERTLLVSGPNTGGKTVLLKAVGLLSALAQAGIIPPVGPGTRLPVFRDIFADIGDEQSIEASLSTFSAHLRNLHEIVEAADAESLVLVDEMGSGTDPIEGAALARSILVELTGRGALTVATTHLGELKQLAADESRVVNASLDFDAVALRPTYRLRKGVPGRSYGLAIARRLGFPGYVLERAEAAVPGAERRLSALLEEVESKERTLAAVLSEAESARASANRLQSQLREREASLESRERSAERRARQQAKDLLLEARSEVEAAIRELKDAAATAGSAKDLDDAVRRARRRVEERAQAQTRRATVRTPAREPADIEHDGPNEGDHVRIEATGAQGRLVELRDERAVVDIGGVRIRVAAADLIVVPQPVAPPAARTLRGTWAVADFDAASEVDLRGMRADEAVSRLQPALDAAIQAALPSLRIIHGKGTGALREVVADVLRADSRIRSYRAAGVGEGGTGVTVVEFA